MKLKILLISSNPTRDLSLDDEYRTIERAIKIGKYRNSIELVPKLASRIEDLIQALNEERPHIIHFTGHGNTMGELMFTNDTGYHAIPINALKKLFEATSDNIRLIFLDACYSKRQAEVINSEIDYVIGMNTSIGEDTATTFAEIFYNSFTSGRTIIEAFNQAKVMLEINHPKELNTPELLIKNEEIKDIKLHDMISLEEDLSKEKNSDGSRVHYGSGDIVEGDKTVHNNSVNIGGSNSGQIITGDNNKIN